MSFETLLVIGLAALAGPLLGLSERRFVPVVVGEILAGVIVGPLVLDAVRPSDPTVSFLAQVGFAMLMLSVGMHLPLREPRLRTCLRDGAALAALVAALAVPAGLLAARIAGTGHAAVYSVLLASGSAAVLLPALEEARLTGARAMTAMAQVTLADVVTIVAVPIVLQPGRVGHAALGTVLVALAALALLALARLLARRGVVHRLRRLSRRRRWALDLRLSLISLFLLAWLAQRAGTSVLIAGFGAGVVVAALGGPKRLSTQMRGVAEGFFIPLFFVVLGARLDLEGLVSHPAMLALAGALTALNVLLRLIAALLARASLAGALAASAQLGVPAAVASLGLSEHLLSSQVATAIVAAALASLAVSTVGIERLVRTSAVTAVE